MGNAFGTFPWVVTTDASGNVYVGGTTSNALVPVTPGALQAGSPSYPNNYVFLTKLTPTGGVVFGAIPGAIGSASLCCSIAGIALDPTGNIYLTGSTGSSNHTAVPAFPTTPGAYQTALFGSQDAASPFVAKVAADGSQLLYSTLVGGGIATGMALTSDQQVILAGHYPATNYPVTSDAYSAQVGQSFLSKISTNGTQLTYSTFFSTPTADTGGDIAAVALDPSGDVWVGGQTQYSNNIPMVNPLQSIGPYGSTGNAFLSEFDPTMHQLLFSTYFNGVLSGSKITGLALDSKGRAHIVGDAQNDMPTTPTAFLPTVNATNTYNNLNYEFGFAALIDATVPGPGICFVNSSAGQVQLGSSGQGAVTITNCGNAPLNVSSIQLSTSAFALASPGACVGTLAPAASCVVNMTFTPTVAGSAGATLTVASNALIPVYSLSISGTGTAPSVFLLTPSITFAPQVFGIAATATQDVVFITNKGTAPLTVSSSLTTITGDFSIVRNSCVNVFPNSSCTLALAFTPSVLGTRTGVLTLVSNDPVHPTIAIPLSGTSVAQYPQPTITVLSVPSVAAGTASLKLNIIGTNFFPTSTVVIGGEVQPLTGWGSTLLSVNVDPFLLTAMGELSVTVINPSPGGQSNTLPLVVFRALPISANGLVYNPGTQLIYVSIGSAATTNANTILPINPITGVAGTPIPVGNNPGKLALSSDGAYLYVALNTDHTLQRINLSTLALERTFPLPADSSYGPTTVPYMHGVPGSPQSVVVALRRQASPSESGAALFNDSGLVNYLNNNNSTASIDSFAFTSDPSVFYAFPFNNGFLGKIGVAPTGLSIITSPGSSCCDATTGSLVAGDSSLLYTNSGEVWNPATATLVGTYTASSSLFYEEDVLPDTANQRTFVLDAYQGYNSTAGYANILSFDQTTFRQVGSLALAIPEYNAGADLSRWGSDGFAFRTSNASPQDQIVIARSSLLHLATGGTPTLTSLSTSSAQTGSAAMQITLTGSGFLPGTTALWNGSPLSTLELNATQLSALVPAGLLATAGTVQVTVANPGGGTSAALPFTVTQGPTPAITFSIPTHIYGDAPFTVLATSNSSGAITYSVVSGPAVLSGATLTITGAGSVVVQAAQAAAGGYSAATQNATFAVSPAPLTVTAANATRTFGTANPAFSASITGTRNQDTLVATATSAATTSSPVGTYAIVPSVSDAALGNYTVTPVNGVLTVTQASSATTLAASSTSFVVGTSVTFTATVSSSATGTPTGSVQFLNGTTVLGTGALSAGTATYATAALPQGTASVTAVYAGDTNFSASQSTPLAITVAGVPSYSVTASPSSLTIKQGQSGTSTLTVTPINGFNQAVSFSCGNLPAGVTCAFVPAAVTPSGSPATTVLTVTTSAPQARLHLPGSGAPFTLAFTLSLASLAALRRRRKSLRLLVAFGALVLPLLSGCGGSSTPAGQGTGGTPVGTSQISIVNSSGSGASQSTFNLTIIITN